MKAKKIYNAFMTLRNAYILMSEAERYKPYINEVHNLIDNLDELLTLYNVLEAVATPADLDGDNRLTFNVNESQTLREWLAERRYNEPDKRKKRDFYVYFEITYEFCFKTREAEVIGEKWLKSYE